MRDEDERRASFGASLGFVDVRELGAFLGERLIVQFLGGRR